MEQSLTGSRAGRASGGSARIRCDWARTPLSIIYHDREWGVPVHDDRVLFEFLTLEGAQAGLSWETILRKREAYREAFAGFDPGRVARFTPARVERLLRDDGIVRNRLKVESTVRNAQAVLAVQREHGSLDAYLWSFVGGAPRVNRRRTLREVPARTPESEAMSRDLQRRGFRFVGPTICYALMQAVGMVNDHTVDCFRHGQVGRGRRSAPSLRGEEPM
jgi:DNA-3-methyladenine glycosylase I